MTRDKKLQYYQQLITDYQGMIFRVCRIYGGGDEEFMRDLFQDISLALWESLDHFQGRSQASTWVWNVAQKTALYRQRKKIAEERLFQTGLPEELSEVPAAEPNGDIEELYLAIAQLDADDQQLVALRLDEKSYGEIALLTGVAEGALRTRYSRIVQQLRRIMDPQNDDTVNLK